jgi:hypothetical protein
MDLLGSCNKHSKKGIVRKNVNLADRKPGRESRMFVSRKIRELSGKIAAPLGGASRCDPA